MCWKADTNRSDIAGSIIRRCLTVRKVADIDIVVASGKILSSLKPYGDVLKTAGVVEKGEFADCNIVTADRVGVERLMTDGDVSVAGCIAEERL